MTWEPVEVTSAVIIAGIPIILARIIVAYGYERRTSRLWTFLLPTLALGVLFVRIAVTRTFFDLLPPDTWLAALSWAGVVVTQLIACIYAWWPDELMRQGTDAP